MPTQRIEIFKTYGGERWENVYYAYSDEPTDWAYTAANRIVTAEASFHLPVIEFSYYRISTVVQGDNQYVTVPLNAFGARQTDFAEALLPLFNTIRLDISRVSGGRPGRKYYRGALREQDITYDTIDVGLRTLVASALATAIGDGTTTFDGPLTDEQGNLLSVPVTYPRVQMRQLRRGSRRRPPSSPGGGSSGPF
jgi:hypothetical protein